MTFALIMCIALKIAVEERASADVAALERMLTRKDRMYEAVGLRMRDLTQRHIIDVAAPSRHETAQRLGASYTNYLAVAGQSVTSGYDSEGATVTINQNTAIFSRVNGAVEVRPFRRQWLTIPASAEAYGKRAREFMGLSFRVTQETRDDLLNKGLTFIKTSKGAMLVRRPRYLKLSDGRRRTKEEAAAYREELKAQTKVVFWLKKEVTLSQDRGLLPSDDQYLTAFEDGVRDAARLEIEDRERRGET